MHAGASARRHHGIRGRGVRGVLCVWPAPCRDRELRRTCCRMTDDGDILSGTCPLPVSSYKEIVLAHGSGGKLSQQLIQNIVLPAFRNDLLAPMHDGAIFE